jgi:Flp pilus assembly pilin Flp
MKTMKRLVCDERGLETVEYAIITGLIVVGVIATINSIGDWVRSKFETLDAEIHDDPS